MVGGVGGWEAVAAAAHSTLYIGFGYYGVVTGAQAVYSRLHYTCTGKIGYAC